MIALITSFDQQVLQYLFAHRDVATTLSFINISELGSTIFVVGIGIIIGLLLLLRRNIPLATSFAVSIIGGGAAALVLKEVVRRARPDAIYQAYLETGYSFPSGHATLAAALYGSLMYLAWHTIPSRAGRIVAILVLAVVIGLIAFSRLYLGVHYVSDVLGGLVLGGGFAWLGNRVSHRMRR